MEAALSQSNPNFMETFALSEMIGKGCFGSVWKAVDNRTGNEVAVKVIDRK